MQLKKTLIVTTVVATVTGGSLVAAGAATADPVIAGTFNTVKPVRVLDTRAGTGAAKAVVGPNKSITFNAAGSLGTKLVSAEALTIAAADATKPGYLTVAPVGAPAPTGSTLNYQPGAATSNEAIVGYGSSGTVTITNVSSGSVNLVADLSGYWTGGSVADDTAGAFQPLAGARILDTRTSKPASTIPSGGDLAVPVLGQGGVPATGVAAVVLNVTVPSPLDRGYLAATANATDQQGNEPTSDVSFQAGQTHANLVVVPVDTDTDTAGDISLHNGSLGVVGAVVDVTGYFTDGAPTEAGSFAPSTPFRANPAGTAVPSHTTVTLDLGVGGSPSLFQAVAANLTVVNPAKSGYLTVWSGGTRPNTTAVNFPAKVVTATAAITTLNANGTVSIYNGSAGPVTVLLDVHGFFINDLSSDTPAVAKNRIKKALTNARRAAAQRVAS